MPAQIEIAIPLGRRIGEIMEEKGDAFSYRAFGERVGISKDILSRCINGERYIKPSELEKICRGLNISEARLKQEDFFDKIAELSRLLISKGNPKRAIHLAEQWMSVALGMTERCSAFSELGRAYYGSQRYSDAHLAWLQAYDYAKKIQEKYNEKELLISIVRNLMLSFTVRKEYIKMSEIIEEAKDAMFDMPEHMGAIYYSKAKLAEQLGDNEEARKMMYLSLERFIETQYQSDIGRAKINVAHYEYKFKNYRKAKQFLGEAIEHLANDKFILWIAQKEFAKVLIKLGESSKAGELIRRILEDTEIREQNISLYGKFKIMLGMIENKSDPPYEILNIDGMPDNIRYFACTVLINHYRQLGDSISFMRYYDIAESLGGRNTDLLEMEGF